MAQSVSMSKFVYNPETAHEDFPEWKMQFENFLLLAGINKTDNAAAPVTGKIMALRNLIHAGGTLAIKLLNSFDDPDTATYATLVAKFEAYCAPKDIASTRFKFDTLKQKERGNLVNFHV